MFSTGAAVSPPDTITQKVTNSCSFNWAVSPDNIFCIRRGSESVQREFSVLVDNREKDHRFRKARSILSAPLKRWNYRPGAVLGLIAMRMTHFDLELVDECWGPRSFYRVNWGPGLPVFSFSRNEEAQGRARELWFNVGSNFKAKASSRLAVARTGRAPFSAVELL